MNEQAIQLIVSDLGYTIAQLHIDLAAERANVQELTKELEQTKAALARLSAPVEAVKVSEEE